MANQIIIGEQLQIGGLMELSLPLWAAYADFYFFDEVFKDFPGKYLADVFLHHAYTSQPHNPQLVTAASMNLKHCVMYILNVYVLI